MFIILVIFSLITLLSILVYIISFCETLIAVTTSGIRENRIKIYAHVSAITVVSVLVLLSSDVFKSKRILTATLKDDLFHFTLVFRENGSCEMNIIGMFGYQEDIKGSYYIKEDTIIFTKKPYTNNFITNTILIDKEQQALFLYKDSIGNFETETEWLNHFKIIE